MDYTQHGYLRVAAAAPPLELANPTANAARLIETSKALAADGASLILFPELSLTGYSCEDLFGSTELKASSAAASNSTTRSAASATGSDSP